MIWVASKRFDRALSPQAVEGGRPRWFGPIFRAVAPSAATLLVVAVSVAALATSHPALADSGEQTSAPAGTGTGKTQSNEYARGCENIWMSPPPGVSPPAGARETQPPAQEQWKPYANAKFGYHFLYPSSAKLDARDPAHVLVLITEPFPNGTPLGGCDELSFEVIVRAVPSGSSLREMAHQYYVGGEENIILGEEGPARLAGQPGYRMTTWGGDSNINHFFTVRRSLLFEVQYAVPDTMGELPPQGQARAAEKFRRMRDSLVIN